jgi:hypothetical protein
MELSVDHVSLQRSLERVIERERFHVLVIPRPEIDLPPVEPTTGGIVPRNPPKRNFLITQHHNHHWIIGGYPQIVSSSNQPVAARG